MFVTCKEGKHFIDLSAARKCADEHNGCAQCEGPDWYSYSSEIHNQSRDKPEEVIKKDDLEQHEKIIRNQDECPDHERRNRVFPCPRCRCSEPISERTKFLNMTTWWICHYPNIVNLKALQPDDL